MKADVLCSLEKVDDLCNLEEADEGPWEDTSGRVDPCRLENVAELLSAATLELVEAACSDCSDKVLEDEPPWLEYVGVLIVLGSIEKVEE